MGVVNSKSDNGKRKTYEIGVLTGHTSGINAMALSDDNAILATGSDDRTVRLWTTKLNSYECFSVLVGHEDYVTSVLIEDIFVVSGSADRTIRKWDMGTSECIHVFRGHKSLITRVICTGDFLFSSCYDRTARCWDFDTGECIRVFVGHKRGVYPMTFIPAEELEDDDDDDDYDDDKEQKNGGDAPLANHDILITGSADHTAIIWSFETGRPLHILKEHTGAITCMATDTHGKILVTGSTDHTIRSWDIQKGERLRVFVGHQSSITCVSVTRTKQRSSLHHQQQPKCTTKRSTLFLLLSHMVVFLRCLKLKHLLLRLRDLVSSIPILHLHTGTGTVRVLAVAASVCT